MRLTTLIAGSLAAMIGISHVATADKIALPFNEVFETERHLDGTTCTLMFSYIATEAYRHAGLALVVDAERDKDIVDGAHPVLIVMAHAETTENLVPFAVESNVADGLESAEDSYSLVLYECGATNFRNVQANASAIGSSMVRRNGFFGKEACYTGENGQNYYVFYGADRDTSAADYLFKEVNQIDSLGDLCI